MRRTYFAVGGGTLLCALLIWCQVGPREIAQGMSPSLEARIVVREIQLHPLSLGALLRANGMVYRCEYYPHPRWPMFSAQTFSGESFTTQRAVIIWRNDSVAQVVIADTIAFECTNGEWRRAATRPSP